MGYPEERDDEAAAVREQYADRPGLSGQIEQALAERANAVAYGTSTAGPDKRLRQLGHAARQRRSRPEAAEERKAAAGDGEEARREPPEGRQSRPKDTAAAAGPATAAGSAPAGKGDTPGGKQKAAGGK
jgi:hypothetical protein